MITINKELRIKTANDSCGISLQSNGKLHVGYVSLEPDEIGAFCEALHCALEEMRKYAEDQDRAREEAAQ